MTANDNKKTLKISVYTICKNEEKNVDRWADSNSEADVRLVCDTGSTDGTVEKLKSRGIDTYSISVMPWRFDVARNSSLNLLPDDVDVCIWQDLDEVLLPGWRKAIEDAWHEGVTTANHRYRHNNGPWQWHYKIHARHNCYWRWPVHEKLAWTIPTKDIWVPEFYLDETQDVKEGRGGYIDLLELKIQEGDTYWKTYAFLAGEYQSRGMVEKAIEARLKSYDNCEDGGIVKSYIGRLIGSLYSDIKDWNNCDLWFQRAVADSPERETLYQWAKSLSVREDWESCYITIKKCLEVTDRRDGYTQDPTAWGVLSYDLAALASYKIGMFNKALEFGKVAVEMEPNDERLKTNLKFYEAAING